MKLDGPDRFGLQFDATKCAVVHPNGMKKFTGRAAASWPKLYVVVADRKPIYVGITRQSISGRLRLGWNSNGSSGYYGYAWRHRLTAASLFVWYADADHGGESQREMETIEAEIVFAIRAAGQWPAFQTEIHFYPSDETHRQLAADVLGVIAKEAHS
jgi:hypothetical protein